MTLLLAVLLALQEKTAEQLIQELHSDSVEQRRDATSRLKELGKTALPALEHALSDRDPEVAQQAKQLILRIAVQDKLTPNLVKVVSGIEDRISLSNPHNWTDEFLKVVSPDPGSKAFKGLKREDLQTLSGPALRGSITADEKMKCCKAVARFGLSRAVPELIHLAEDSDHGVQDEAIQALGVVGNSEAVSVLAALLRSDREIVRMQAARALAVLGAKDKIPDIVILLKGSKYASGEAALALAELGATEAIPQIVGILKSEDSFARWKGAYALGCLGATEAVGDIATLTKDPKPLVRGFAVRSLGDLGAIGQLPVIVSLLKDPHREVRRVAIDVLAILGDETSLPSLLEVANTADADERQSVIESLERFPTSRASSMIEDFLQDTDAKVRLQAATSLCRRGSMKGVPLVLKNPESLASLNGIRSPEAWKRIRETRLPEPVLKGTPKDLIDQASRKGGFILDWRLPLPEADVLSWMARSRTLTGGSWTLLGMMDWLEELGPCTVLVESDRIKICSREEAQDYWNAWWKRAK